MTILLGKRDKEPICCAVCGRQAGVSGHVTPKREDIAWLCDDPTCWQAIKKVYKMTQSQLSRYEEVAITDGAKASIDAIGEAMLGAMWNAGVRNLEQLDGEKFAKIAESVSASVDYQRALKSFLETYGASIKRQFVNGDAPF